MNTSKNSYCNLSASDKLISFFDNFLNQKSNSNNTQARRPSPAQNIDSTDDLNETDRKRAISMLRVNHSGEICAQALYQGQALLARSPQQYQNLMQAAAEEQDHLNWCQARLTDLQGRTSILNPFWYAGSFMIGACAGLAGDKFSMGFIAETEQQVSQHLDHHLKILPKNDIKSRAVLEQMRQEEMQHANDAERNGAISLPLPCKLFMRCCAKVLTVTAALF